MDYGDGTYQGIYQFNTKYRKKEVCGTAMTVSFLHLHPNPRARLPIVSLPSARDQSQWLARIPVAIRQRYWGEWGGMINPSVVCRHCPLQVDAVYQL